MPSDTNTDRRGDYEEFRVFAERASAEQMRSWLEFEGVPSYVEPRAHELQFVVFVLKKLAHRARWIAGQLQPTDAELDYLATGKLPGQDEEK